MVPRTLLLRMQRGVELASRAHDQVPFIQRASATSDYGYLGYFQDTTDAPGGFWTVQYYQKYFDVDTQTVCPSSFYLPSSHLFYFLSTFPPPFLTSCVRPSLTFEQIIKRCTTTLWPFTPSYHTIHTSPTPDFYGPFWTLTTLIFSLFVFSSFTASLIAYLSPDSTLDAYDFSKLSWAVTVVYSYGLGLPALVWIALRYWGVGSDEWPLIEALSAWGYGMFVWIPISVCLLQVSDGW
jgi:hypothetical protein